MLLSPDPSLPAEKQAAVAARVRRDVVDLRGLAECPALAPDHPWRAAAAALHQAFEAVTTGPVGEDALALPEVSRSSPLAPWKMLVRAIAAWYRCDDAMCEKCLAAVMGFRSRPPGAALAFDDASAADLTPAARRW